MFGGGFSVYQNNVFSKECKIHISVAVSWIIFVLVSWYLKLNKGHIAKQELNPNLQSPESDPPDGNKMSLDECYLCLKDMFSH